MQFFRATCLATPFLQTLSHYETSCFTGVTLSNVSINLSRFDDHMRIKEQFHWLVPQTVAIQVAAQMLHCAIKKFVAIVAESRTQFYVPQRFHQLVSQRFWPLQGMLHWAMIRAIGLLQLTITWYKIRHAGGQAHYYSPTGTLKQRDLNQSTLTCLCFNVPVGE